MSDHQSNSLSGIDKYSGSFEQDELGVTMIPTVTINLLTNFVLLGLFTYLASRPADWKLNAKHLSAHFDCNKEKIYNAIDGLIELGLLTRTQVRNNGKFARYHYRLHLRQIVHRTPCLEKPDTVKPDTVKPDTYKTNILPLQNREYKTTTTEPVVVVEILDIKDLSQDQIKSLQDCYISNPFKTELIKNVGDFIYAAKNSIENRESNVTIQGRIKGIIKLVKSGLFEDPPKWKGRKSNEEKKLSNEERWSIEREKNRKKMGIDYEKQ